ncbi:MAG: aspartate/glutamate racemase family protein [Gordonia sp. (in: high G+C Gram-positive bacteria)]|uniref:aspartate/glutamate racemase family protein n=1 Tax=Gordonia sp. (in: high G+C Gram-positive bacteria) TaxID=84139 RepID=UPI0039E2E2F4
MRLTVVNGNTTAAMTAVISESARAVARPDAEITAVTPRTGPVSIESHYDEALAVPGILDAVAADPDADGYLIACFGDPGIDAAREIARAPVLGIAEAAMHVAATLGRGFSVVTTLGRSIGRTRDLVAHYGFSARCLGIHACEIAVLDLESDPNTSSILAAACRKALAEDGSDAIVLGCAGMADLARSLSDELGVPVIDGVAAGIGLLSGMAAMGLHTGTASGEFAPPLPKEVTGSLAEFARRS